MVMHILSQELDLEVVREARALELEWYMVNVYEKRPSRSASRRPRSRPPR